MLSNGQVVLGQYTPADSYLHKLDTRAKILPVLLILILGMFSHSLLFYVPLIIGILSGLLLSGLSPQRLLSNYKPLLLLIVITALYHLIFSGRETELLWQPFGLSIREGALTMALFFSMRLILFISIVFIVTMTSSPSQLSEAIVWFLSPLRHFRFPVDDIGLILFMAIRFIPLVYEEFVTIRNAQKMRGLRFDVSLPKKVRRTVAILIPVFIASLNRADELALALQVRGYRSNKPRTVYTHARIGSREYLFLGLTTLAVFLLFRVTA